MIMLAKAGEPVDIGDRESCVYFSNIYSMTIVRMIGNLRFPPSFGSAHCDNQ